MFPQEDLTHWQIVFFIAAGVYAVGTVLFCLMASGEEQSWNKIENKDGTPSTNNSGVGPKIMLKN